MIRGLDMFRSMVIGLILVVLLSTPFMGIVAGALLYEESRDNKDIPMCVAATLGIIGSIVTTMLAII